MDYFIITGASSGLGKETARLLLQAGHHVISVSRKEPGELARLAQQNGGVFTHMEQDLTQLADIPRWMNHVVRLLEGEASHPATVCLIHSAASAGPFMPLDAACPDEIERSYNLNLTAPAMISSLFIRLTKGMPIRKKLVLVSSGSAEYPMAGMSLYCSAKAGLNMLARCLQEEQRGLPHGVRVAAVDPGMMDTPMQTAAREAGEEQFPAGRYFRSSYTQGRLASPAAAARLLVDWVLDDAQWTEERLVKVRALY